jgi:hypothetical protein
LIGGLQVLLADFKRLKMPLRRLHSLLAAFSLCFFLTESLKLIRFVILQRISINTNSSSSLLKLLLLLRLGQPKTIRPTPPGVLDEVSTSCNKSVSPHTLHTIASQITSPGHSPLVVSPRPWVTPVTVSPTPLPVAVTMLPAASVTVPTPFPSVFVAAPRVLPVPVWSVSCSSIVEERVAEVKRMRAEHGCEWSTKGAYLGRWLRCRRILFDC